MARQKKDEEKGELLVSVEQFTRTRDQVIVALTNLQTGLAHVQNGLNDLLRAYMTHTTSILSGEGGTIENLQLPPNIAANASAAAEAAQTAGSAIAQALIAPGAVGAPDTATDAKKKRKREKKLRDPNAPKRPLTAAFLYAQTARPIVKNDLEAELAPGQKLEPNAVNIEVTKRWNEMADEEKEGWRQSYRTSMEQWKVDAEIYKKSGLAAAFAQDGEEHSDEAEGGALDTDVEVESEDDGEDAIPAVAKEATPPTTKTPRPNKRQKTAAAQVNGNTNHVAIAPAAGASPAKQTPILPPGAPAAEAAPASTKKDRKKKADPKPIAPAPAVQPEPSLEDSKKKPKNTRATRNTEVEVETPIVEKVVKKRDRSKRKSEAAA